MNLNSVQFGAVLGKKKFEEHSLGVTKNLFGVNV